MSTISGFVEALHPYGIKLSLGPATDSAWFNYSIYGYTGNETPRPELGDLVTIEYVGRFTHRFLRTLHNHDR